MATLRYRDEHNKVGYLLKPTRSDDYHQIIDFLRASHIRSPELADDDGIDDLPIAKIYSGMDKLGLKSGSWAQFRSPIAIALICLSDGRCFNWSSYIFKGMVSNIGNAKKFLMYPRFLQSILDIETRIKRQYKVLMFSCKLFANMRLNFEGHPMPLLPAMLLQAQAGEGAEVAAKVVPQHMPALDQPQDHLSTPPRQQTYNPNAPVLEHGQSSFHMSPPGSTQAPPADQPSGGADDPITLTALSYVVSTLVQQVNSLETELKDYKKLFKDVVGKLVKKVKAMEVKLKTKKRKMVVSDSDQEEGGKQDVDLDALRALANAAVTVDSNIPYSSASTIPATSPSVPAAVSTGASTVPAGSPSVPADVPYSVAPAGASNKGKYPMVEEEITVKERTFKQMQEDILGEQAAKRLYDEEQAQLDRQRVKLQRRREEEVLDSAMYYTEADWLNIMARVEANASLFKTLLSQNGCFNQSSVVYTTGWSMAYVKSFTDDQLKEEFEKIQKVQSNSQIQAFSRTLKRIVVSSPPSSGTRKKSLGRKHLTKPISTLQELDLDADAQTFIKVVSTEDSDDEVHPVWSALIGWEVISTPLGDVNALYRIDQSTKHFTTLRKIPHMVDRQDLVLFDSHAGGKGSCVWQHQHLWEIRRWRLYTLSNVHVLETVSGEVLYMFADVSYPLSVKLMERMLTHKLEIDTDVVGNDMTTAEQLIQFIKNQLAAGQVSSV
nr:aminoacyl-tRNA synthetase, class 1a, anticodon-binding [Tanacetum cinerariifolium]